MFDQYITVRKTKVHVVRTIYPAHMRYYVIVGFVTEDLGDRWRILVAGSVSMTQRFIGAALLRSTPSQRDA